MNDQSHYFQTIARTFFKLRGTPFFLSSNELSLIEKWEASGIPLRIVLEGIKSSFSTRGPASKGRIRSLSFCEPFVREGFVLYKERTVGRRPSLAARADKKKDILEAVTQFLTDVPSQVEWLALPFKEIQQMVLDCSDDDLEEAEERIDNLIASRASSQDQEEAKKEAKATFPDSEKDDFQRIIQVVLIKRMRGKYKIPHVAPFLY